MAEIEHRLSGGNATADVVRVDDTVRKPWTATTEDVHDYLRELRRHGIDVPEPRGRDAQGRQVIEYVTGTPAEDRAPLGHAALRRVGRIIRRIHDASPSIAPSAADGWPVLLPADENPDLICHNDLAPWNLVTGERWVFIDWDGAGPSTRLWDLAYSAQSFGFLVRGQPVDAAAARLRALVDGYGADDALRRALPDAMTRRTAAMLELLCSAHESGWQPWARMYAEGHGDHWRGAHEYVARHQRAWAEALTVPAPSAASTAQEPTPFLLP